MQNLQTLYDGRQIKIKTEFGDYKEVLVDMS